MLIEGQAKGIIVRVNKVIIIGVYGTDDFLVEKGIMNIDGMSTSFKILFIIPDDIFNSSPAIRRNRPKSSCDQCDSQRQLFSTSRAFQGFDIKSMLETAFIFFTGLSCLWKSGRFPGGRR